VLPVPVLKTKGSVTVALYCSLVSHKIKPSTSHLTLKLRIRGAVPPPYHRLSWHAQADLSQRTCCARLLASVRWQLQTDVQCDVITHVLTIARVNVFTAGSEIAKYSDTCVRSAAHKQFHNLWCSDNDSQCMLQRCVTVLRVTLCLTYKVHSLSRLQYEVKLIKWKVPNKILSEELKKPTRCH